MPTMLRCLVLGAFVAAGCLGEGDGGPAPPVGGPRDRLVTSLGLALEPGSCRVAVTAEREVGGAAQRRLDLPVLDGAIAMRTRPDGLLEVEDLRVHLDDVVLDATEYPPDGLRVTGIALSLRDVGEAEAEWSEAGAKLKAHGQVDLLLDLTYVTAPGAELPLGTQTVTGVAVEIEISTTDDGKALVKVHARRHGQFAKAEGLFALSELELELRGVG